MNLHEYQAKELLKSYGLPIQEGIIAHNGDEAAAAFDKTPTDIAVIKAQVKLAKKQSKLLKSLSVPIWLHSRLTQKANQLTSYWLQKICTQYKLSYILVQL